jgi:hypothetical protein
VVLFQKKKKPYIDCTVYFILAEGEGLEPFLFHLSNIASNRMQLLAILQNIAYIAIKRNKEKLTGIKEKCMKYV